MEAGQLKTLALVRGVIGYLGEREQYGWWQSSFFSQGSKAFLSPIFGRTQTLAQCVAVTRAAALTHDERIGIGRVYHLFRLPEDLEQRIHSVLHSAELSGTLAATTASTDAALQYLRSEAGTVPNGSVGPTRVGDLQDLRSPACWRTVIAHYICGFRQASQVYPYFADGA
jgi:hypothetical protein